jgi:hypothetical protein
LFRSLQLNRGHWHLEEKTGALGKGLLELSLLPTKNKSSTDINKVKTMASKSRIKVLRKWNGNTGKSEG